MIHAMPKDIYKSDFNYQVPEELIAKYPTANRSDSKILSFANGVFGINPFSKVKKFFQQDDLIVFNETKVFKARLLLQKDSGGKAEIFISKIKNKYTAECLTKGLNLQKKIQQLRSENFPLKIEIIEKDPNLVLIKFNQQVEHLCRTIGHVPIPPYLNRQDDETDKERYQTVFANKAFTDSVAAPTASLHFDEQLFKSITEEFKTTTVSLAVGLGTFKPLSDEPITESSSLHEEEFYISDEAAESMNQQLAKGKKIIAIGTTTLRALEAAWCCESKQIKSGKSSTNIFIKEGYEFKVVDTLITNFHLPQSSLLMLVSAFSSKDFIFEAYKHAIENNLRFFSYGDAMIIER
jgi:S-adenosylmethionine:tRNA ribosyltransferase-isomerase